MKEEGKKPDISKRLPTLRSKNKTGAAYGAESLCAKGSAKLSEKPSRVLGMMLCHSHEGPDVLGGSAGTPLPARGRRHARERAIIPENRTHLITWEPQARLTGPGTRAFDELRSREEAQKTEENVGTGEGGSDVVTGRKVVKDEARYGLGSPDVADVPPLLVAGDGGVLRTGVRCVGEWWVQIDDVPRRDR